MDISLLRTAPLRALRGALGALALLGLGACGPGGDGEPEIPEGAFGIDLSTFVGDQRAIAAGWYDYDFDSHILTPFPQSYVVVDTSEGAPRYAAFRVLTYYDEATAESGHFSLAVSTWSSGWAAATEWSSASSIRTGGAVCLDLFTLEEPACDGAGWQLQLRVFPLLVPEVSLVVGNPGIFLRSVAGHPELDEVRAATLDVDDLTGLPDPTTLAELDDGPSPAWDDVHWDRGALAPNLPERGMVVGRALADRAEAPAHVLFLLTASLDLVRFSIEAGADPDTFQVTSSVAERHVRSGLHLPFGPPRTVTLAAPSEGGLVYLSFADDDLVAYGGEVPVADQLTPPFEDGWDCALERVEGALRLVLSPSALAHDLTAAGGGDVTSFDDAMPPLVSP